MYIRLCMCYDVWWYSGGVTPRGTGAAGLEALPIEDEKVVMQRQIEALKLQLGTTVLYSTNTNIDRIAQLT